MKKIPASESFTCLLRRAVLCCAVLCLWQEGRKKVARKAQYKPCVATISSCSGSNNFF
jgi:hypothetical protein